MLNNTVQSVARFPKTGAGNKAYRKQHPDLVLSRVVCKIAAKKVLNNALEIHKENHPYDCFANHRDDSNYNYYY